MDSKLTKYCNQKNITVRCLNGGFKSPYVYNAYTPFYEPIASRTQKHITKLLTTEHTEHMGIKEFQINFLDKEPIKSRFL